MMTSITQLQTRLLSAFIFSAALITSSMVSAQMLDRILVVVNDDVVTQQELQARLELVKQQYRNNPNVLPSDDVLSTQILDSLILESLQLQMAERGNLIIPEQQIDSAISSIAQRQNLTLSQFLSNIQNNGQSINTFREQIRRELTINELQRSRVGRQIFISDAEVNRFLNTQSGQTLTDTEYTLSYQRFDISERDQAEALLEELNAGANLLDNEGARDLGSRTLEEIPSIFKTLVPVLNLNEAALVENNGALHLTQLTAKSEEQTVNIQEHKIRHILVTSNALFDKESSLRLITELKTQIESGAPMATLADEYSEDTGSKGLGGDLGWNTLDNFVPEFAETARNLAVGELSDVIETTFGYHILRVEDVRTRDVGLDVVRNQIRNQLSRSRYSESLQIWLSELRAESYVEFRN